MEVREWPRTGRKRLTARRWGEGIILVLQVEIKSNQSPVRTWRDARIDDLTEGCVNLDAFKVAA